MKTNIIAKLFILCLLTLCNFKAYSAITVVLTKYDSDVPDNVCNSSTYKYIATVSGVTGTYELTITPTNGTVGSTEVSGFTTTATIQWNANSSATGYLGKLNATLKVGSNTYTSNQISVTIKSIKHLTATFTGIPYNPTWNLSPCDQGTITLEAGAMPVPGTGEILPEQVNSFEWFVPAGWTVNGVLSTGTWIKTSTNVTVTYPKSGTNGTIKVRASYLSACGGDIQVSKESTAITVNRGVTFTLTPNTSYILCGDVLPVTYTVTPALPCAVYYWNNSPTSTTNNSFQITPDGHSPVNVTVTIVYGTSTPQIKTSTMNYVLFPPEVVPVIEGALNICTGNYQYNVSNLRPGYLVTWTVPAKLLQVSVVNNILTVSPKSTGSDTIKANVSTICGIYPTTITKKVFIGKPVINPVTPLAYYDGSTYNNVCNLINTTITFNVAGTPAVDWTQIAGTSNITWSASLYNSKSYLDFYFYSVGQTAAFRISGSNGCGITSYDFGFKSIDCSGGGGGCGAAYLVSPNPANSKVIIVPQIPAPCIIANATTLNQTGTVTVYDQQGILKQKTKYSYNTEAQIDVSKLKNGTYVMQIYDGNETVKKTIVVKH